MIPEDRVAPRFAMLRASARPKTPSHSAAPKGWSDLDAMSGFVRHDQNCVTKLVWKIYEHNIYIYTHNTSWYLNKPSYQTIHYKNHGNMRNFAIQSWIQHGFPSGALWIPNSSVISTKLAKAQARPKQTRSRTNLNCVSDDPCMISGCFLMR